MQYASVFTPKSSVVARLSSVQCPQHGLALSEIFMMRDKTPTLDASLLLSWWGEEEEQGFVEEEDDKEEEEEETKRELYEERENNEEEEEGISRWFSTNQLFGTEQASF